MHVKHNICLDCSPERTGELSNSILTALGHGPALKLRADLPTDTVHGSVTMAFCDTRTLGVDELLFQDGHVEIATAQNIDAWWREQGHQLDHIVGNKAHGNTIVDVELYDAEVLPNSGHKSTLARAVNRPTVADIRTKLDSLSLLVVS